MYVLSHGSFLSLCYLCCGADASWAFKSINPCKPCSKAYSLGADTCAASETFLLSSSTADTGTEIRILGSLQNEPANPSSYREEPHTEPLNETISRPSKKKYMFAASPYSYPARQVHEELPNQAVYALEAQGTPSKSSVHTDKVEDRFGNGKVIVGSKQKVGNVVVPSIIEQERTKSLDQAMDEQQAGEIPNNMVHADKVQADFAKRSRKWQNECQM